MPAIIGHERIIRFFETVLASDGLSHAYLFVGPSHLGKTTMARWLIEHLMGQIEGHPDVLVVSCLKDEKTNKQKSEILVEQARELIRHLSTSPLVGSRKMAFVEDAGRLNRESANALLKSLEEPASNALVILRAEALDQLPATIASRCQVIRFGRVSRSIIAKAMRERGLDESEATELAARSDGRPGRAIALLSDGLTQAADALGEDQFFRLTEASICGRIRLVQEALGKEEARKRERAEEALRRWKELARDALLVSTNNADWSSHPNQNGAFQRIARRPVDWMRVLRASDEGMESLAQNGSPSLALEHFALSLSSRTFL